MKIALIGYGKMGKKIEQVALERNHIIGLKITEFNLDEFTIDNLKQCDLAIEFSSPDSAVTNFKKCFDAEIPVVCGTTGWYKELNFVKDYCQRSNGTFIYASNFSIGVNLFFELNKKLAAMMGKTEGYSPSITEIHHVHKKDKPSGTAITLANGLIENIKGLKSYTVDELKPQTDFVNIKCLRENEVVGTHIVSFSSSIDQIEIKHEAYSRKGFATGAVLAAEWIINRKGFFEMSDFMQTIIH